MKNLRTARQRTVLGNIAGFALLVTQCAVAQSEAAPQWDGDGIIEPGEDEVAELARAAQNPIASMISTAGRVASPSFESHCHTAGRSAT